MVDTLYYQQPCSVCGGFHNQEAETTIHFSPKIIEAYLRKLYGKKFDVKTEIEPTIWREVLKYLNQACVEGISQSSLPPTLEQDFYSELKRSNGVFSALKVHSMGNVMASMLTDENGKLKPFRQWKEDVASIASHYMGSWLQTEYNTAVIRAHNAADWLNFERNKDIFPNLRWMPTVSPDPDEVHRRFWERKLTRPINDPFWNKHRPGDRWNCKCSLEATDDPVTDIPGETDQDQPQPGLKGNPAKTKQIFDKSHPYFPKDCSTCPFTKNIKFKNLFIWFDNQKRNCYNCKFSKGCLELASNDGFVLKNQYKNGGKLLIHPNVDKDKDDYHPMVVIGQHFAKQGNEVKLTPRVHIKDPEYKRIYGSLVGTKYYGKCPDLQIGNKHYEFESFSKPWKKNKVKRMLTNGVVQSQYIIIDNSKGASDRYIRKCIMAKKRLSTIEEVWIYEKGEIRPFFLVDKFI